MKNKNKSKRSFSARRFTSAGAWFVLLAFILFFLLAIVWKQVYIRQLSINQKAIADSLVILQSRLAELKLQIGELSDNSRIEKIAIENLGLIHPVSDQIKFVEYNAELEKKYRVQNVLIFISRRLLPLRSSK